ncbi:RagB/SusD family nutrient uptake outer membrane protein [Chitinophaga alhagiae]|uniref:RagB/SusD family nutrient uptake outer membrane protein n=1 Tax=Chitinophaga alhagiae TaxID=2203219 RepID=UPI001E42B9EA|nr:RagB/SusD family nutrient uptake outer membrane protein [Chitinophaga alhagiae]
MVAAEIYELIISDLQFAVDHLPLKGATPVGRITKGAAETLLAKVYLYQKNWQKAFELSKAVIDAR